MVLAVVLVVPLVLPLLPVVRRRELEVVVAFAWFDEGLLLSDGGSAATVDVVATGVCSRPRFRDDPVVVVADDEDGADDDTADDDGAACVDSVVR